jgi:hypothetical protein
VYSNLIKNFYKGYAPRASVSKLFLCKLFTHFVSQTSIKPNVYKPNVS